MNQNSKDPNKKHYFNTISKKEIQKTLEQAADEEWPLSIWSKGAPEEEMEFFTIQALDVEKLTLGLRKSGSLMQRMNPSKFLDQEVFMKIKAPKNQYFCNTHLNFDQAQNLYWVKIESNFYKTLQRSNYRLMADKHVEIRFKIDNKNIKTGLDISAGGLSFIIKKSEAKKFEKGAIFKNALVTFNRFKFEVIEAQVAGQWKAVDPESGKELSGKIKVGISFEKIEGAVEERLFRHINSEARMQEIKKMLSERSKG